MGRQGRLVRRCGSGCRIARADESESIKNREQRIALDSHMAVSASEFRKRLVSFPTEFLRGLSYQGRDNGNTEEEIGQRKETHNNIIS